MTINKRNRICPVERAGMLDLNLRKLFQNPQKILRPYISKGMTVLDLGCGPGFFSTEIARMVGRSGKVIAADLQEGMLEKLRKKIQNKDIENIIKLHKCRDNKIGLSEKVDFILIFYMLHEVPDQSGLFQEIKTLLNPDGKVLIIEPKLHVLKDDFEHSIGIMKRIGFDIIEEPKVFYSRSIVIRNSSVY